MSAVLDAGKDAAERLLAHVQAAMEILCEERAALVHGAFERIAHITRRKEEVLAPLESAILSAPRTENIVDALRRLIAASRRNEAMLDGAREGFVRARRRIAAIARARRGVIAYHEDGSPISCRADRADTDKSA